VVKLMEEVQVDVTNQEEGVDQTKEVHSNRGCLCPSFLACLRCLVPARDVEQHVEQEPVANPGPSRRKERAIVAGARGIWRETAIRRCVRCASTLSPKGCTTMPLHVWPVVRREDLKETDAEHPRRPVPPEMKELLCVPTWTQERSTPC
jgi:hypothetical protein